MWVPFSYHQKRKRVSVENHPKSYVFSRWTSRGSVCNLRPKNVSYPSARFMWSPVISSTPSTHPIGLANGYWSCRCRRWCWLSPPIYIRRWGLSTSSSAGISNTSNRTAARYWPRTSTGNHSPCPTTRLSNNVWNHAWYGLWLTIVHGSAGNGGLRHCLPSEPDGCAQQINKYKTISGVSASKRKRLYRVQPGLTETGHSRSTWS